MSLIRCKECDSEISDTAVTCPSCGAETPLFIEKKTRNKRIIILIALILVAPLAVQLYQGAVKSYYITKIQSQLEKNGCSKNFIYGATSSLKSIEETEIVEKMYKSNTFGAGC